MEQATQDQELGTVTITVTASMLRPSHQPAAKLVPTRLLTYLLRPRSIELLADGLLPAMGPPCMRPVPCCWGANKLLPALPLSCLCWELPPEAWWVPDADMLLRDGGRGGGELGMAEGPTIVLLPLLWPAVDASPGMPWRCISSYHCRAQAGNTLPSDVVLVMLQVASTVLYRHCHMSSYTEL
jgi:hypothetical protein